MIAARSLEIRPAAWPEAMTPAAAEPSRDELARLFGLDRLPPRRLVCRWRRDRNGRLVGVWEAGIGLVPRL